MLAPCLLARRAFAEASLAAKMASSERPTGLFTREDLANINNMLFDEDTYDIVFFLYAVCYYAIFRIACEHIFPGKVKSMAKQQYIVTLLHDAIVLPLCAVGWVSGMADAPALIYLLTGAYLASDSIVNYTPLAGCVAEVTRSPGVPDFNWGVHLHHAFTILLCALGPNLPERAVVEGAICVFLGEFGSLWVALALIYPYRPIYVIRFYSFLVSRVCGFALAADMAMQIYEQSVPLCIAWLVLVGGLALENLRTMSSLQASRLDAKHAGKEQ